MLKFLSLESRSPYSETEIHKSSIGITELRVYIVGVIPHGQEILPTKENVDMFRELANILEERIK